MGEFQSLNEKAESEYVLETNIAVEEWRRIMFNVCQDVVNGMGMVEDGMERRILCL